MAVRFRSLVRRVARPAAMVGVVGILSVSLVVSTPSNAQAFSNGDDLLKAAPRIAGAVKTVAPVAGPLLAVATSVTPMGWLLKGGYSLAMLAFSTSDVWMPYVTGLFGAPADTVTAPPSPPGAAPSVYTGFALTNITYTAGQPRVRVNGYYSGSQSLPNGTIIHALAYMECKNGAGASNKRTIDMPMSFGDGSGTYQRGSGVDFDCPGTYPTPVGIKVGAWGADVDLGAPCAWSGGARPVCNYPGPTNVLKWGTFSPDQGFDPRSSEIGYQGRSECIDSAGTVTWISGPTIAGSAGGVQMPSCEAAGKGHGTGRTQVIAFKPDGTQQPVWDVPVAPSDPSTPMCDPGKSSGGCVLSVELDGKGCEVGNVECENWAETQKNDPNQTRLKCRFGPYTLPMAACNLLEQAYRAGGALATERNTDGDPATQDNNNYAGQPVPQPLPGPIAAPGAGAVPGGGGQLGPQADQEQKECFPTGWGMLNPVEWVMKPVGCALQAAFQPKKDLQTRLAGMQGKFSNKVPVSWFGVGVQGASGGGCPADWAVNFDGHRYSLICGTEADNIIRGFRPVLGAMLIMAMLWPFIRSLFYAAIPVFKVNPS